MCDESCGKEDQRDLQEFVAWAREEGISTPKVQVHDFSGVRGMRATGKILAGELLVSVPQHAMIRVTETQLCPFPDFVSVASWSSAGLPVRLALSLLYEVEKGPAS
eukprot:2984733-Rhodomonas_salina.1